MEFGAGVEVVALPEVADLGEDLLAVGVAGFPLYGGVEAVHEGVDLEAGGGVDFLVWRGDG